MRHLTLVPLFLAASLHAQTPAPTKAPTPPKEPTLTWHPVGTGAWNV
jgi:hypothetical protein